MIAAARVREHGELLIGAEQGLELAELDFLEALCEREGKPFLTVSRRANRWYARFAHYVGAIGMPGGRTLEILPKIAELEEPDATPRHVRRMLAETGHFPSVQGELGDYAASEHLIDAYLRYTADRRRSASRAPAPR